MYQILRCTNCLMALDPEKERGAEIVLVEQPGLATKRMACGACGTGRLRFEVVKEHEWNCIVAKWQKMSTESEGSEWNSAENCLRRD